MKVYFVVICGVIESAVFPYCFSSLSSSEFFMLWCVVKYPVIYSSFCLYVCDGERLFRINILRMYLKVAWSLGRVLCHPFKISKQDFPQSKTILYIQKKLYSPIFVNKVTKPKCMAYYKSVN